mmetsp:Transcript_5858/g.9583  ORF Transcript_5858/g.9583 Transcript_5858/m.9583 type:complete len:87 (-) Transcript_5858:401-661(-)
MRRRAEVAAVLLLLGVKKLNCRHARTSPCLLKKEVKASPKSTTTRKRKSSADNPDNNAGADYMLLQTERSASKNGILCGDGGTKRK